MGCGGGEGGGAGATTIAADEYAQRADEICGRAAADVVGLDAEQRAREILSESGSDSEKMDRVADILDNQLEIIVEFREQLERLGRPSTGAEDVDAMLNKARSAEDELAGAVAALRDGDAEEFAEAAQRYAELSQESAAIARDSELDFAVCGSGL